LSTSNPSNFVHCALASELLNEQDIAEARAGVRWSEDEQTEVDAPPTDQQLADRLVEMEKLNPWQAIQLLAGRTKFNLNEYWITDSIGQGGMGQVFEGKHSLTGQRVAIKVLPLSKSTPEAIENFIRESRVLASLDHKYLVRAIDANRDGNVYYLVTEYVPGADLRKLVRRDGPLNMQAAAKIIIQVAEGLQHAHEEGLIHRDVKPGNVLVTPEGNAKLSDLGLAGPLAGNAENDPRYGKIVGTADYISPDHIQSPWDPTAAWDIYSLGCTLYWAVSGSVPFPGGTTAEKAKAHCELRPLDPRRLNAGLSMRFVDVLADMMAKDPQERTGSLHEVIENLKPWAEQSESEAAAERAKVPPVRTIAAPPVVISPQTADGFPEMPKSPPGDESDSQIVPIDEPISSLLRPPAIFVLVPLGILIVVLLVSLLIVLVY
jgi:serine/threonine protein kinase